MESRDWSAKRNKMPGSDVSLQVHGECWMPTPNYSLKLSPADRQGANDRDYILVLTAQAPGDAQPEVMTWTPVDYSEPTEYPYDTVSVMDVDSGEMIAAGIPIEDVSREAR